MIGPSTCPREEEILEALRSGVAPAEDLRRHAESCPSCADAARVEAFLRREGRQALADASPPPAGRVLLWARRRERLELSRRADRPIRILEMLTGACGVIALAAAILWQGPALAGAGGRILSWWRGALAGDGTGLVLSGLALALALFFVALHWDGAQGWPHRLPAARRR